MLFVVQNFDEEKFKLYIRDNRLNNIKKFMIKLIILMLVYRLFK